MAGMTENKEFTDKVIGTFPLDNAVDWIQANMQPDEVFGTDHLFSWAEGWVEDNSNPEELYSKETLCEWAEANGYVEEEK